MTNQPTTITLVPNEDELCIHTTIFYPDMPGLEAHAHIFAPLPYMN